MDNDRSGVSHIPRQTRSSGRGDSRIHPALTLIHLKRPAHKQACIIAMQQSFLNRPDGFRGSENRCDFRCPARFSGFHRDFLFEVVSIRKGIRPSICRSCVPGEIRSNFFDVLLVGAFRSCQRHCPKSPGGYFSGQFRRQGIDAAIDRGIFFRFQGPGCAILNNPVPVQCQLSHHSVNRDRDRKKYNDIWLSSASNLWPGINFSV